MRYQNILVSCTLAIGDVVMATSAVALLKKIYPGARITMLVKKLAEEMALNNPVIDEVLSAEYRQKQAAIGYMAEMVRHIKHRDYDLFVSLDGKFRPALLASLAGIPVRIGPKAMFGSNTNMPLLFTHRFGVGDFKTTHYCDALRDMIRQFAGSTLSADPVLPIIMPENKAKAEELLQRLPKSRYLIGLCAKTNPRKTWPPDSFVALLDRLAAEYDAAFYVVGGGYDREYNEAIIRRTQAQVANLCGDTSLVDFMALLTKTDLFMSLDTAPMHIASAMNVPMVAIFGCTAPQSVAPLSKKAVILAPDLPCIPCIPLRVQVYPGISKQTGPKECPHDHACMRAITVDVVAEAVKKQLELI